MQNLFVTPESTIPEKYTLGLDIGMASVGAALLATERIIALHVRTFDKAETPDGESLNSVRRNARLTRRRLRRRTHRLLRLSRLLKRHGLIEQADPEAFSGLDKNPWQLRAEGLDRLLTKREWAAVLYHIIKHRGFQSNRKSEAATDEKVDKMLGGVSRNQQLLAKAHDEGIRTIGELLARHEAFGQAKRNKGQSYSHTLSRTDLVDEVKQLFACQQQYGNPASTPVFEQEILALLLARRPALSGGKLLGQVGYCTFEPDRHRAPKAMYRAERFVWLTRLNNLRLQEAGVQRPLTPEERAQVIDLPYTLSTLSYRQLRKKLNLAETVRFSGLSYRADQAGNLKDMEGNTLFEAKSFQALRKALKDAGLEQEWARLAGDPDTLDAIALILTAYKTDAEIRQQLLGYGINPEVADALLHVSFDKFIALSQQALKRILPFMEAGQRYDEAVQSAGYAHHGQFASGTRYRYLPKLDKAVIRNPIVFRALNQARKLVNAIIREYGPPAAIHIELARDLNKPVDERKQIKREQDKFQARRKQDEQAFAELFGHSPTGQDLSKWRLYREQNGQCAYSLKPIDAYRLFETGYAEIDHALPYSRSFDDSMNNKVLVLTAENRNKGNRTPYEYLDGASGSDAWRRFSAWVESNHQYWRTKRLCLLRVNFGADESASFLARNLNDTRYICREFKTLLETQLQWHPAAGEKPQAVVVAGKLTALLRTRWGLLKVRENGDLHHALDAAVIAACNRSLVKRMADHARRRELEQVRDRYVDPETGEILDLARVREWEERFPMPWPHFRHELLARLSPDPASLLQGLPGYDAETCQKIQPVRVSRAPKRLGTGAIHQDKIRSIGRGGALLQQGQSAIKTALQDIKLKDVANIVGIERDTTLKEALTARLRQFGGDGSKAFADNQPPLFKPSKGSKTAPIVRSVKLLVTQNSGQLIRKGIAKNDRIIRADIFSKAGRFYMVPVYVADAIRGVLPNKACTAAQPESEWPEMDENYTFLFTLYPNDWLRITYKGKPERAGYYAGLNRSTALLDLWTHDRNQTVGKQGKLEGNGIKTALAIEKYHVDLLGRLHRAGQETRQALKPVKKGQKG